MKSSNVTVPDMVTLSQKTLRARLGADVFKPKMSEIEFYKNSLLNQDDSKKENEKKATR